jgi:hypothetical protein
MHDVVAGRNEANGEPELTPALMHFATPPFQVP